MNLELVTFKIRGIRPLMQSNAMTTMSRDEAQEGIGTKVKKSQKAAKDEAAQQLYQSKDGKFYHPAMSFWKAVIAIAPNRKLGRLAVTSIWPQAVSITEEEFWLMDPDSLNGKKPQPLKEKDWVYELRRIPAGILVSRPKWRKWGGLLTLEIDRDYVNALQDIADLLSVGGRLGIGAGRMRIGEKTKQWGGLNMGKFVAELK